MPVHSSARRLTSFVCVAIALWAATQRVTAEIPANYSGLHTGNAYQPLPTTRPSGAPTTQPAIHVEPIAAALRESFQINRFYTKTTMVDGVPIIGSDKVSDYALLECAYTLDHMLKESPPKVREALVAAKVQMGIIAVVEYTMDMPENQTPDNLVPAEAAFQDRRSRGLGGLPMATCAEENLLNLRGDPYTVENITIHEFSHTVASAIGQADPAWYKRLRGIYRKAMAEGLFAHSYSATNEQEYWAEGAQAWFDCAARRKDPSVHSGIWTREQVKSYDPRLAQLLTEVYGDGDWRYVKTTNQPLKAGELTYARSPDELAHLEKLDRARFPVFDFEQSPRIAAEVKAKRGKE